MSSNGTIQIRRVREATQGTTPAGSMLILPFGSFDLSGSMSREQPENVRADRQVVDNPATDIEVSGSGSADAVYADYDGLIEEAMGNAMVTGVSVTGIVISAAAAGNNLNHTTAAAWAGFVAGDFIIVSGFTTNGALFLTRVTTTPSGDGNLATDTTFKTLVNEAAGASITVKHAGRFRLGTSMLTASYERWNTLSSKGNVFRGVGCGGWQFEIPHPNKCKQTFQLRGLTQEKIAAQLANGNTQPSSNPSILNSNVHFGAALDVGGGLGFRYDGTLVPNLRFKRIMLNLTNPQLVEGAVGTLGPVDISLDNRFELRIEASVFRTSTDAESLIDDASNPNAVRSIGFGFKDGNGNRSYFYLPKVQPASGKLSPAQQSGREMFDLAFIAKLDSTHTMFQYTKLT